MSDWFQEVAAESPLTQGDIIPKCLGFERFDTEGTFRLKDVAGDHGTFERATELDGEC